LNVKMFVFWKAFETLGKCRVKILYLAGSI